MMRALFAAILALLLFGAAANAQVPVYYGPSGSDSTGNGTVGSPYRTLYQAFLGLKTPGQVPTLTPAGTVWLWDPSSSVVTGCSPTTPCKLSAICASFYHAGDTIVAVGGAISASLLYGNCSGTADAPVLISGASYTAGGRPTTILDVTGGALANTVTYTQNPANNDTLIIGNTAVVTLVSGTPSANQVQIGASLSATLTGLCTYLSASADPWISKETYSCSSTVLTAFPITTQNRFTTGTTPHTDVTIVSNTTGSTTAYGTSANTNAIGLLLGNGVGVSYVVLDGFDIQSYNSAAVQTGHLSHDVYITNSYLHDSGCGGFASTQGDNIRLRFIVALRNAGSCAGQGSNLGFGFGTVFNPSELTVSGWSQWHNMILDSLAGWGKALSYPYIDPNTGLVGPSGTGVTDGQGIIVDTKLGVASGAGSGTVDLSPTLIFGNISIFNGGRGIHAFNSTNVKIIGNTTYSNLMDHQLSDTHACAELDNASLSVFSSIVGNIASMTQDFHCLDGESAAIIEYSNLGLPENAVSQRTIDFVDWNDAYNSASTNYMAAYSMPSAFSFGVHNISLDPGFANPDTTEPTGYYSIAQAAANYAPTNPAVLNLVPSGLYGPFSTPSGPFQTDILGNSRCLSSGHTDMGARQVTPCPF